MAYVLLRRTPVLNTPPAVGFTVFTDQYDLAARRPARDAVQAMTNTGASAPFELAIGSLVPGASFCVGNTQRQVKYAGDGKVSTHDAPNAPACATSLANLVLTTTNAASLTDQGTYSTGAWTGQTAALVLPQARITATWSGGAGALVVRCALLAPGLADTPAFYTEITVPEGATTLTIPAATSAPAAPRSLSDTDHPRYERLTTSAPAGTMAVGRYRVEVLEATGGILAAEIIVYPSKVAGAIDLYKVPYTSSGTEFTFGSSPLVVTARTAIRSAGSNGLVALFSNAPPAGMTYLSYAARPISENRLYVAAAIHDAATGLVTTYVATVDLPFAISQLSLLDILPPLTYFLPAGPPTATSSIFSNGQGGVVDQAAYIISSPRLELGNLIYFHPPTPTSATGGVVVEAVGFDDALPADAQAPGGPWPRYTLLSATGAELATNSTGRFGGLLAGAYTVRARNQAVLGVILDVPVVLVARYGLKYRLRFNDQGPGPGKACRLELWARGYVGPVLDLCGQAEPVTLETEGFAGGNTQPDLPASIGSSLTMRLLTASGALAALLVDDRAARADFYYDDQLEFSGYVQPDIYEEPMVGLLVAVELTATDGLAALKDVDFAGHVGQELRGRRPVINTLLHCLSRTDLALPVAFFANRRALEMSSDEQPETDLYTDRLAYLDKDKPLDLRSVLNALCAQQGGTLVQRQGRWEMRAALEMAGYARSATIAGRAYDAAGDHATAAVIPTPSHRIAPARLAEQAQGQPSAPLAWLNASQHQQRRAGWRYLTASGDATYEAQAFRQGDYFAEPAFWDASATALLPQAGWKTGSTATAGTFPIRLVEAGPAAETLATEWPRASGPGDGRYLESELAPLVADAESVAYEITVQAKCYFPTELRTAAPELVKQIMARLWVEVCYQQANGLPGTAGQVVVVPVVAGFTADFSTVTVRLPLALLPGGQRPRVRLHPYSYITPPGGRFDELPVFLLKSVGIQLLPQGATWKAADSYYAGGAGGSVRPAGLEVFHVDAPQRAGLFGGVAYAFRRTVTRGPAAYPTTQWARADDVRPAPLLASAVLDTLALRANPSRVLGGALLHYRTPPAPLDAIDAPYDTPGRRYAVGARAWHVKSATSDVSLVEVGAGEALILATLPPRVLLVRGRSQGRVRLLLSRRGGVRAIR